MIAAAIVAPAPWYTANAVIVPELFAALAHPCGTGDLRARRGLRLAPGQRCGGHDAAAYRARVTVPKRVFARLAAEG